MADKPDKKDAEKMQKMQKTYMELQMIDQQMKQVQKQVELVEQKFMELEEVQQNLDALAASKQGSDMWVPVANGIFLKAKLEDTKKLAVNVGSDVVVAKDVPSTKEMLAAQATDMRNFQAELVQQFEKMAARAAQLHGELQELAGA